MSDIIRTILQTPIPIILIVSGLIFIMLGFVSKVGGIIEVSPKHTKYAIIVGLVIVFTGLYLYRKQSTESTVVNNTNKTASIPTENNIQKEAEVVDKDGFAYIREGKGINFKIIGKVNSGEIVYIIDNQGGDWWKVKTKLHLDGYMHRSRLRILIK